MPSNDALIPEGLTQVQLNAIALADAELDMLADLVQMRRAKGMTQEDVAAALGRNKSAVSRFERLDSDPRLSTVRRYARAIGALIEHRVTDFGVADERPEPPSTETPEPPIAANLGGVRLIRAVTIQTPPTDESSSAVLRTVFGEAAAAETEARQWVSRSDLVGTL